MSHPNIDTVVDSKKIIAGSLTPVVGVVQLVTTLPTGETVDLKVDPITGALVTEDKATKAALNGLAICRWVNDRSNVNAAPTVLTNGPSGDQPGIYYNLASNDVVVVTQLCIQLETISDSVDWELGWTTAVNGGGTFTPITPKFHLYTGAASSGVQLDRVTVVPPGVVKYSDGARSITMRVQTNDAAAQITPTWHGYIVKV